MRWSGLAPANSARYSSSVRGRPASGRRAIFERWSEAKKRGSLTAGMKISGWLPSIRYSAVVPHLGCPAMKNSGSLPAPAALAAGSTAGFAESDTAPRPDHRSRRLTPSSSKPTW